MRDHFPPEMKGGSIGLRHRLSGQSYNILLLRLALIFFAIAGLLPLMAGAVFAQGGKSPETSTGEADVQRLAGRWIRPDGGYILELREIKKDGSLKASYFNPRPINVFSAKWSRKEKKISLFVELRDVNYPGSTYNLQYDPKTDRLKGIYFQAVERQTYDIHFVRTR